MKSTILAYLILLLTLPMQAQDSTRCSAIPVAGLRLHRSFIIQHTPKLKEAITQTNPWSLETEIAWHLRQQNVWNYCTCYPRAGFALRYINFDLPDILGSSVATYAFIEPFIRPEKALSFSIRFGLGPAYLTHIHDEQTNPDNLFFGSHLSFIAMLNLAVNYRVTNRLTLRLAGDYNHISNGGYAEPNLGMNFPSVNLGADYSFQHPVYPERTLPENATLHPPKNRLQATYGISFKPPSYEIRSPIYPVHCLGVRYSHTLGRIFALAAGAEWINDRSLKALIKLEDRRDESGELYDHNRISALAGMDWLFGRFIFSQHFGYYLYAPVEAKHKVYQRYTLGFRVTEHILTGISVKAHAQDADFIDVRVGFTL